MTDRQLCVILNMISMILDGCKDLDEAKRKIGELAGDVDKKTEEQR